MVSLANLPALSKYTLHARVYPALLAALPVTVLVVPLIPSAAAAVVFPLLASSGLLLFVVQQVRSFGIKTEERLKVQWDGIPTTRCLRLRNVTNAPLLARRREKLQAMYGEPLPDAEMEESEPTAAEEVYVAATRYLITKVRQNDDKFPLVQEENISYGFRRNFRGIKWLAVALGVLCLVADGLLLYFLGTSVQVVITAAVHVVYVLAILFFVTDSWVREIGERYADRLFEALDAIGDAPSET